MIMADTTPVVPKLKIKFSSQKVGAVLGKRSCEVGQQLPLENEPGHTNLENNNSLMSKSQSFKQKSSTSGGKRRNPSGALECQLEKRRKMDRNVTQQCSVVLKALMRHPAGWVFNQPVDPVALGIPDYFSIITNPMDLGTIKSKLEKNSYSTSEEFASDVRLTFSNAMLYNPPTNNVHRMAEELNNMFDMRWKSLEDKWCHEKWKIGSGKYSNEWTMEIGDMKQSSPKTPPLQNAILPKRSKLNEGKPKRSSFDAKATKVKSIEVAEKCMQNTLEHKSHKGTGSDGKHTHGSEYAKPALTPRVHICVTCSKSVCGCSLSSDSTHASSDISFERSLGRGNHACGIDTSKLDCRAKGTTTSQMSKSDPDSDGAVSAVDDENICPSSQLKTPVTDATSGEGWKSPAFDIQLSPTKALRAAMLKKRFADTILKAQHKTLLDNGDKTDPVKLQQEKERLERRQREEKARIEAQIRAAEAASRKREEMELKRQREREREAARVALQKMEKTVEIEQNLEVLKELEMLSGCSLSYNPDSSRGSELVGSPLARLGLFMKDDDIGDEDDAILNGEEGEIIF